ncbi:MAG: hypothetical protein QGI45_03375 [Myxococcota bacterium]|jgi:hypothetical protein|nr:hypothetical protein [Myxococcota bacterium]
MALSLEAQPLIKALKLKRDRNTKAFPLYMNNTGNISLVVSGKGATNCAAATNYIAGMSSDAPHAAWLNIGVAGHASATLGEMFFATKIESTYETNSFHPTIRRNLGLPGATILSVSNPTPEYPSGVCVDMEAAAFCQNVKRFAATELIQCLKIISDNQEKPWTDFDTKTLPTLFDQNMPNIATFIEELLHLSNIEAEQNVLPGYYQELTQMWKFSQTQDHQLQKLLRRWETLEINDSPLRTFDATSLNRNAFLETLEKHLDTIQLKL